MSGSDKLKNDFHRSITAALADLDDSGVTTVPVGILGAILGEHLVNEINLLGSLLAALCFCGNFHNGLQIAKELSSGMQTAGSILGDLLLNFVVNSDFLAVDYFFDALAVFVLAGNFCIDSDSLKIVALFNSQSDHRLNDLADFLGACLGSGDLSVIDQSCDLVAEQGLSELGLLA